MEPTSRTPQAEKSRPDPPRLASNSAGHRVEFLGCGVSLVSRFRRDDRVKPGSA
jgi:hypothetical protein